MRTFLSADLGKIVSDRSLQVGNYLSADTTRAAGAGLPNWRGGQGVWGPRGARHHPARGAPHRVVGNDGERKQHELMMSTTADAVRHALSPMFLAAKVRRLESRAARRSPDPAEQIRSRFHARLLY